MRLVDKVKHQLWLDQLDVSSVELRDELYSDMPHYEADILAELIAVHGALLLIERRGCDVELRCYRQNGVGLAANERIGLAVRDGRLGVAARLALALFRFLDTGLRRYSAGPGMHIWRLQP